MRGEKEFVHSNEGEIIATPTAWTWRECNDEKLQVQHVWEGDRLGRKTFVLIVFVRRGAVHHRHRTALSFVWTCGLPNIRMEIDLKNPITSYNISFIISIRRKLALQMEYKYFIFYQGCKPSDTLACEEKSYRH